MNFEDDEFVYDVHKGKNKASKKSKMLDDISQFECAEPVLPSAYVINRFTEGSQKKKKDKSPKKEVEVEVQPSGDSEWLDAILDFKMPKKKDMKKKSVKDFLGFDIDDDGNPVKKKKKGKHKGGQQTNYRKEFESESTMLRNLYLEQSKFTDSLQKKYDAMNNTKSSARGIGKFTTDLIEEITAARSATLQIVKEQIALKKNIADLTMKERKEFGVGDSLNSDNAMYASTFMNELLKAGRSSILGASGSSYPSYDSEQADPEALTQELIDSLPEGTEAVPSYIQHENDNVEIVVIVSEDGTYRFEARTGDGDVLDDYELPAKSKMQFNYSTHIATDYFGRKYKFESDFPDPND